MLSNLKLNNEQKETLSQWLVNEMADVEANQTELLSTRRKALAYYTGEEPAVQSKGSSYVSRDVADAINRITPEMVKVFCSSHNAVSVVARQVENVDLANHLTTTLSAMFEEAGGYENTATSIRNGLLYGAGFLKTEFVEKENIVYESYEELTEPEATTLLADENVEIDGPVAPDLEPMLANMTGQAPAPVLPEQAPLPDMAGQAPNMPPEMPVQEPNMEMGTQTPIDGQLPPEQAPMPIPEPAPEPMPAPSINIKVKRTITEVTLDVSAPPPDRIYISAENPKIEDCRFVVEKLRKTKSELIAMGYKVDDIEDLQTTGEEGDDLEYERNKGYTYSERDLDRYDYYECYIKYQLDDKKEARNIKVCAVGDNFHILATYDFEVLPYSMWSPIFIPNALYGESVAEQLFDIQYLKTQLQRQINDNTTLQNNPPRIVYPELLTNEGLAQLRTPKIGQTINVKLNSDAASIQPIQHLQVPYTATNSLQLMEQVDKQKAERIGISPETAATDINVINKSATEAMINENTKHTQMSSYIRQYAEFCLKPAMKKALKLALSYEDDGDTEYTVDNFSFSVNVGLGTDTKAHKIQGLMLIAQEQQKVEELYGTDSPFLSMDNILETSRAIAKASGIENPELYLPRVSKEEVLQWQQGKQNMAMDQEAQAAQMQMQQAQMAEQAKLQEATGKLETERMKLEADTQIAMEKIAVEREKLALDEKKFLATQSLKMDELRVEAELKDKALEQGNNISTNIGVNS